MQRLWRGFRWFDSVFGLLRRLRNLSTVRFCMLWLRLWYRRFRLCCSRGFCWLFFGGRSILLLFLTSSLLTFLFLFLELFKLLRELHEIQPDADIYDRTRTLFLAAASFSAFSLSSASAIESNPLYIRECVKSGSDYKYSTLLD